MLERCMSYYDPDAPEFCNVKLGRVLDRLEAAVHYLQSIGWAHNDIKPGNVMLRTDRQPVLDDFESCARVGTPIHSRGTENCILPNSHNTSCVENDLYAWRLFRERIRDNEALELCRGH